MSLVLLGRGVLSYLGIWTAGEDDDSDDESADIMMDLLPEGANPWTGRPSRAATDFYHSMLVLIVLLLRPHNIAVVAVTVTLQHCIVVYLLPWLQWSPWKMTLLFVWLGQSTFYAQVSFHVAYFLKVLEIFSCSSLCIPSKSLNMFLCTQESWLV